MPSESVMNSKSGGSTELIEMPAAVSRGHEGGDLNRGSIAGVAAARRAHA
jgi:hypothetical protein